MQIELQFPDLGLNCLPRPICQITLKKISAEEIRCVFDDI